MIFPNFSQPNPHPPHDANKRDSTKFTKPGQRFGQNSGIQEISTLKLNEKIRDGGSTADFLTF